MSNTIQPLNGILEVLGRSRLDISEDRVEAQLDIGLVILGAVLEQQQELDARDDQ